METNKDSPGISGKENKRSWFNSEKYHEQREFIEGVDESEKGYSQSTGQNLHGRDDLTNQMGNEKDLNQQKILEVLKRSPEVDISHVDVSLDGGSVILKGEVEDPKESRAVENLVKNIPGVRQVQNQMEVKKGTDLPHQ